MTTTHRTSSTDVDAPADVAVRVAVLYARVLRLDEVGDTDDFFALGGDSLAAVDLLEAVQEEFGIEVPARRFYRATAVCELADVVRAMRTGN